MWNLSQQQGHPLIPPLYSSWKRLKQSWSNKNLHYITLFLFLCFERKIFAKPDELYQGFCWPWLIDLRWRPQDDHIQYNLQITISWKCACWFWWAIPVRDCSPDAEMAHRRSGRFPTTLLFMAELTFMKIIDEGASLCSLWHIFCFLYYCFGG